MSNGLFGKFQVDSRTQAAIFAGIGAILGALSTKAIPMPMGIPPVWADYAQSWSQLILALWAPIGPAVLVLFSNSRPGPLAPPDPPVVVAATQKAEVMDKAAQVAKVLFIGVGLIAASSIFTHAHAAVPKHRPHAVNCTPGFLGCPAASVTPVAAVTPVPTPVGPVAPKDIFSGLLQFQSDVVATLQQADAYEAAPINAATGQAWNPTAHMCLAGVPQIGTPGQPGYTAAAPGLIAWVQGLQPLAASTVPPLPGPTSAACIADKAMTPNPASTTADCTSAGPATVAVFLDNQLMGAEGTANALLTQINTTGVPSSLQQACGGFINHVGNEVVTATAQVAGFEALLAKYVMPLVAAHKGPQAPK